MLNLNIDVVYPEDNDVVCTFVMREICGPNDEAVYEKYVTNYGTGFTAEELIASCAVDGALAFYQKHGKRSELVSLTIEKEV